MLVSGEQIFKLVETGQVELWDAPAVAEQETDEGTMIALLPLSYTFVFKASHYRLFYRDFHTADVFSNGPRKSDGFQMIPETMFCLN